MQHLRTTFVALTGLVVAAAACSSGDAASAGSAGAGAEGGGTGAQSSSSSSSSTSTSSSTSASSSEQASVGSSGSSTGGGGGADVGGGGASSAATGGGGASATGGGGASCVQVDETGPVVVGAAAIAGEYALTLPATSLSRTRWAEAGNEALVLDVTNAHGVIGQLVLHQGMDGLAYGMSVGHLDAGEAVSVQVSAALSAASATLRACVGPATLTEAADLGDAGEGLANAPIFAWPVTKRFDDLPVMLGWSKAGKSYEAYYTNENGGTVVLCGGGADGMQAELARWGRGCDIERMFDYGAQPKRWERCTATTDVVTHPLRFEGLHPIVYYGDGHNRLYESRAGYGAGCGTSSDAKADGDLAGWNTQNPGNDAAHDAPFVITLRPLPVALDALGYATSSGRREGALDAYAPWLYRITDAELARENKIDGVKVQSMQSYLFVDVHANDVGGSGDSYCDTFGLTGGFKLRIALAGGATIAGPQMTASYFGGQDAVKRLAIPLGVEAQAADVQSITLDAFDNDGMYWLELGDAFIPQISGDNAATLAVVHAGSTAINRYVDDDSSNCSGGTNPDGPQPPYPCAGSSYTFPLP